MSQFLIVGDSLAGDYSRQMCININRRGHTTAVDCHPGTGLTVHAKSPSVTPIDWIERALKLTVVHRPQRVIVFLGTNDAWQFGVSSPSLDQNEFQDRAQQFLDTLLAGGSLRGVYWVTVATTSKAAGKWGNRANKVNAALTTLASHPKMRLVNKTPVLEANPHWYIGDGIHPTHPVGASAIATLITDDVLGNLGV